MAEKPKLNSLLKPMPDPIESIENGNLRLDLVCKRGSGMTHKRLNLTLLQERFENMFRGVSGVKTTAKA